MIRADEIAPQPPTLRLLTDEEADAQAARFEAEERADAQENAQADAGAATYATKLYGTTDPTEIRAIEQARDQEQTAARAAEAEAKAAQRDQAQRAAHAAEQSRKLSTAHMEAAAFDRAAELLASGAGYQGAIVTLAAELAERVGEWAGADGFYGMPDPGSVAKRAIERATADAQTRAALAQPEAKGKPRAWWLLYNQTREWFDGDSCNLPSLDRMLLIALIDHYSVGEHGARPGMTRLAHRAGCCENTARAAVARLVAAKVVTVKSRGTKRANMYTFSIPSAYSSATPAEAESQGSRN